MSCVSNSDTRKIDREEVNGLLGIKDSLAYKVGEIERHLHHRTRWLGMVTGSATIWAGNNLTPFRAISGDNVYGADANDEAQVIGSGNSPIITGSSNAYFDLHELLIVAASSDTSYKLRLPYGTGTMANAVSVGDYSEVMFHMDVVAGQEPHAPVSISMPRLARGTKVWCQAWNATNNATIDFFVGVHEYEG